MFHIGYNMGAVQAAIFGAIFYSRRRLCYNRFAPLVDIRPACTWTVTANKRGSSMDSRLVWMGINTHDLDIAEAMFVERTASIPNFYATRPNWFLDGSEKNKSKIVVTTLAGFAGVFIPKTLTIEQFLEIESARTEKRSTSKYLNAPIDENEFSGSEDSEPEWQQGYKRFCSYCGSLYVDSPTKPSCHCGAPGCIDRHQEYMTRKIEVKEYYQSSGRTNTTGTKADKTPDFKLYDPARNMLHGWVYFIEAENGLVKIGRSDSIEKRYAELTTMSPVHLRLQHAIAASNYVAAEAWLHSQFAIKRDHGEWFGLSPEDMEWAKTLTDYCLDRV